MNFEKDFSENNKKIVVIENIMEKGMENKIEKLSRNYYSKLIFEEERWLLYTTNENVQKIVTDYLNSHSWDGVVEIIFYLDNVITCFPVVSREMFDWIKKNISHTLYDFLHKKKRFHGEYQKLKPETELRP